MGSYLDKLLLGVKQVYRNGTPMPLRPVVNFKNFSAVLDNPSLGSTDVYSSTGVSVTGSGLLHATAGNVDSAAYLGAAGSIPIVNAGGTDTAWLGIGSPGQVLGVAGGIPAWVTDPATVTWANDLSTSSNTHQYVSAISGANGTGGTVGLGDGTNTIRLTGVASVQTTSPQVEFLGSPGWALNSGVGGNIWLEAGPGGSAAAGNNTGGKGGQTLVVGGPGGTSTGTAANSNGGDVTIVSGAAGTGGSGAAGVGGNILLETRAATQAFCTDNAAGPGFGIGTTPGTDPTLTRGTGVPATTQTNGSLFLRTDGSNGSTGLYTRQGGAWFAIGGTTTTSATLTFEGQAFQLAAAGNGNGQILWPVGQATPSIGQVLLASDVTPASLSITAQGAYPSAVTHVSGASLTLTGGQGQAGLQGGQITLSGNNNVVPGGLVTLTASAVSLGTTSVTFQKIQSSPLFGHDAQTSDVATSALTIQAQTAFTGASTNINGASITLKGGNSATGAVSAKGGDVLIRGGDTLSSGTATNGAGVTLQTGTGTSPGDIAFNLGGTKVASFSSTPNVVANTQFLWEDGVINGPAFNFGFRNKTADTAPQPCAISGQNAWSSASTNKTGGSGGVYGGTGVGGVGAGQVIANGGGTASNAGQIWLNAPSGVGVSSGNTLHWMSASPAISATGTTTLSSSQYNCPFLHFTGTITGAVTVAFPNVAGFWLVDLSAMTGYSATNTISFNCGSTTKLVVNSATALSGTDTLVVVVTNGSNTIYLLGSTATAI